MIRNNGYYLKTISEQVYYMKNYKRRIADRLLKNKLEGKGAVLVEGPKWCGKTTTCEQIAKTILYLSDPDSYLDAVMLRYSGGKDVLTDYQKRIGSVTADNVKHIFGVLAEGMKIEYVVKQQ